MDDLEFELVTKGDCDEQLYFTDNEDGSCMLTIDDPMDGNHMGDASIAMTREQATALRDRLNIHLEKTRG